MKLHLLACTGLLCACLTASAQGKYTHSHNDYNNNTPFYKAFYDGFNSIEADIFLVNHVLLVSHSAKELSAERTLKGLYLDPISYALKKDTSRRLCLLIDVKDDYIKTLPALIKALKPLSPYLMTNTHPGRLKILVSGNRPMPVAYKNYPSFLFFDDDLVHPHTKAEWGRVGQVSLNFEKYSKWKGVGALPVGDKQRITHTIDSVHTNTHQLVRFWGAPDSPDSWNTQISFGADIIGTDMVDQLEAFLTKKNLCQPATSIIPAGVSNNQ
jgi:alkaline phosphatase